jgi:WD40 repeat protein
VAPRLARRGRSVTVIVAGLDALAQLAAADPSAVLVVDQFEGLATSDADRAMQTAFAGELAERCTRTPVIVTVRADAIAWLSTLAPLRGLVERGIHLVGPMDEPGLRAAIDGPGRRAGLRVENGLADLMIRDVEGRPGALPLLSHALAETWLRRSGDTLTIEGYRAGGGVGGAVAATADRVFGELTPSGRETARALLLRLVSLNDEGAPIRHRLRLDDSVGGPEQAEVVAALSSARLVTVDVDTIEVTHEVLARAWPRLKAWLEEGRDAARVMEHLATAAQEWERTGRDDTELYRGARLRIAEELAGQKDAVLAATERTFLEWSLERRRDDEADLAAQVTARDRANRRLIRLLAVVAILLVVTGAVGVIALVQRSRAESAQLSAQRNARDSALRDVVARSLVLRASKRDLGALLAVEAYRLSPSSQTESALFATFTGSPGYVRPIRVDAHNLEVGALLPDGSTLAVTDENAGVRLIDIRSGTQVAALAPLRTGVGNTTLSLSTDGRYLAVAQAAASSPGTGSLTVWDLATRQRRFPDAALPFPPGSVAISGDGTLVAVGGGPAARIQVRSAVSGSLVVEPSAIPRPGSAILHVFTVAVVFTPDGHLLAGSQAGAIRLLDPRTGVELRRIDGPRETSENILRLTRDGTSLLTSGARGAMRFDLASGRAQWAAPTPLRCNSFAVAERIGTVLCGDTAGRVTGIDLATGAQVGHKYDSQQGSVSDLILGADGSSLVEVSADAPICAVWELVGGGPASRLLRSGDEAVVDGYTPDGSLILVEDRAASGTRVRLIDATTGAVVDPLDGVTRASTTSDPGRLLAVFDDGTTGFYDVHAHQRASQRIPLPFTPENISAADTRSLVWAQGRLRVVDSATGAVLQPAVDDPTPIFAAAHPDGGHLVTLGINGLELRDDNTGRPAGPRFADAQDVASIGKMLVVATGDGRLLLLDPSNLQVAGPPLPSVGGNTDVVDASSDGRRAAVLGFDRALRAVDVTGREVIGDAVELGSGGGGAALRPDGLRMAAGTRLGVVTWDLDPAHWLNAACRFAGRDLTPAEWALYLAPLGTYQSACPARSS